MTLHPEVMRRAQAEIDAVIGRDRLPTFDDADRLPYIDALMCEVLRWRPVTPLGERPRYVILGIQLLTIKHKGVPKRSVQVSCHRVVAPLLSMRTTG